MFIYLIPFVKVKVILLLVFVSCLYFLCLMN